MSQSNSLFAAALKPVLFLLLLRRGLVLSLLGDGNCNLPYLISGRSEVDGRGHGTIFPNVSLRASAGLRSRARMARGPGLSGAWLRGGRDRRHGGGRTL